MRVLAVGDVCGEIGCRYAMRVLPRFRREEKIDFTVINGENSADGNGITPQSAELLFSCGADVITGGNHTLQRQETHLLLEDNPYLLRPHNLPASYGSGYALVDTGRVRVAVWNLLGQAFLERYKQQNPFFAADELLLRAKQDGADIILVDFHAEATGEKRAFGYYLDGKVSAVFGTHTHIMTADACRLPGGTGYITDLGMTGPVESVLGVRPPMVINRLRDGVVEKFALADGPCMLNGCMFEIDEKSGLTVSVRPVLLRED
ncbi:MAG: YmdB family metallophosphoesterase [Clostridia bacterium]|nr:YmdB family metallophosphoesterase [Clostridia bacterium]